MDENATYRPHTSLTVRASNARVGKARLHCIQDEFARNRGIGGRDIVFLWHDDLNACPVFRVNLLWHETGYLYSSVRPAPGRSSV
jgi:hypothetical protein